MPQSAGSRHFPGLCRSKAVTPVKVAWQALQ